MNRDNVHANCGQLLWYTFGSLVLLTGVCLRGGGGWVGGREEKSLCPPLLMRNVKRQFILLGEGMILLWKGICNNQVP